MQHITTPNPAWHELGLKRTRAPQPEPDVIPDAHAYRGIRRVEKAGRVKWEAQVCHGGKVHYAGVADTPDGAARLYDAYVIAWGLDKVLNFGASNEYE